MHGPNLLPYLICIIESNEIGHQEKFDSDSFIIGFDSHASKTISNQRSHFISNFRSLPHQHIKGISGKITIKGKRILRRKIEDD